MNSNSTTKYGTMDGGTRIMTLSSLRANEYAGYPPPNTSVMEIIGATSSTTLGQLLATPNFPLKSLYLIMAITVTLSILFCLHSVTLCFMVANFAITAILYIFAFYHHTRYYQLLYHCGALYPPDIKFRHHFHRFICPIFLHGDVPHLAFNLLTMFMLCFPFELSLVGRSWFLLFYILPGIGGNLLSAIVHPNDIGVGASTSLFGILAAFEVHSRFSPNPAFYPISWQYWLFLLAFHIYLFMFGNELLRIDPWGHLGGFVVGGLLGIGVFLYWPACFAVAGIFGIGFIAFYLTSDRIK